MYKVERKQPRQVWCMWHCTPRAALYTRTLLAQGNFRAKYRWSLGKAILEAAGDPVAAPAVAVAAAAAVVAAAAGAAVAAVVVAAAVGYWNIVGVVAAGQGVPKET